MTVIGTKKSSAILLMLGAISVAFVVILIAPSLTNAVTGVPRLLSHQGRLLDANGNLLGGAGTEYCFKFSIYDQANIAGGTKLWPSGAPSAMDIIVRNGVFNSAIGDTASGGDQLDFDFESNREVYLQVQVAAQTGGTCGDETFETLSPRQRIMASGYAINAATLRGFTASQSADGNEIPVLTSGNLILGGTNPQINASTSNTLTLQGGGGTGNIQFFSSANSITSGGNLTLAGDTLAVNGSLSGNFELSGYVSSNLTPKITNTFSLGTSSLRWSNVFAVNASVSGTLEANVASVSQLYIGGSLFSAGSAAGWTDDGTTVRLTTSSDNVGIGTATIDSGVKLEVAGVASISSSLRIGAVGAATETFELRGTASTSGVSYFWGNVAIGTTSTTYPLVVRTSGGSSPPQYALYIDANSTTGASTDSNSLIGFTHNNSANGRTWAIGGGSNTFFGHPDNFGIRHVSSNGTALMVDTGGNVGIGGVETINLAARLDIRASTSASQVDFPLLNIASSTGTSLLRFTKGGYLGIGTTTPNSYVSIIGPNAVSQRFMYFNANNASMSFFSDSSGRMIVKAEDSVNNPHFQISGVSDAYVNGVTGNFGIGTDTPEAKLDVEGSIYASASVTTIDFLMNANSNEDTEFTFRTTRSGGGGQARLSVLSSASVELFTIASSGNVGIGETTPDEARLSIRGANEVGVPLLFMSANNASISFGGDSSGLPFMRMTNSVGSLYAHISGSSNSVINNVSGNFGVGDSSPEQKLSVEGNILASTSGNVDLILNSTTSDDTKFVLRSTGASDRFEILGSASQNYFTILKGGNVGIGTTSPARLFEVFTSTTDAGRIRLTQTNTTGGTYSGLEFYGKNGGATTFSGGIFREQSTDAISIWNSTLAALTIEDTSGNVGINSTAPAARLYVNGSTRVVNDLVVGGVFQGAGTSTVSYSRFGTAATTHALSASSDLLLSSILEVDGQAYFDANASVSGNLELSGFVSSNLTPTVTNTYSLGTSSLRWANLFGVNASLSNSLEITGTASISGTTTLAGLTYTWPSTHGSAGYFLQNNGSGTLTWASVAGSGVASDSLDFDEFVDSMTLDANLTVASGGFTTAWNSWFASSLKPSVTNTYSLGTSALRWADLYLASSSLHIGRDGNEAVISYGSGSFQGLLLKPNGTTTTAFFGDAGNASISGTLGVGADSAAASIRVGGGGISFLRNDGGTRGTIINSSSDVFVFSKPVVVSSGIYGNSSYSSVLENLTVGFAGSTINNTGSTGTLLTVQTSGGDLTGNILVGKVGGSTRFAFDASASLGIGDPTPDARLEVVASLSAPLFALTSFSGTTGDLLTVTSIGNVGIGTTSPNYKLAVNGTASVSGGFFGAGLTSCSTGGTDKLLWNSSTGQFSCGTDQTGGGGTGSMIQVRELGVYDDASIATISFSPAHFSLSASNSYDTIVALDWGSGGPASLSQNESVSGTWTFSNSTYSALFTGGNVGIGTSTPNYKLEVESGDVNIASAGAYLRFGGVPGIRYETGGLGGNWLIGDTLANPTAGSAADNIAIGGYSLSSLTTGDRNIAIGTRTLNGSVTTDTDNVAVGYNAGNELDGSFNTALGVNALQYWTDFISGNSIQSNYNTAVGYNANSGSGTAYGSYNTALGANTGNASLQQSYGTYNTYIGASAGLSSAFGGHHNILLGDGATFLSDSVSVASVSYSVALGSGATIYSSHQLVVGGDTSVNYISEGFFGSGVSSSAPTAFRLNSSGGSGTNIAGANLTLAGGRGTGTGAGGSLLFQTAPAGSSGTSQNALVTRLTIDSTGRALFANNVSVSGNFELAGTASISGVLYANGGCIGCGGGVSSNSLDFDEFVDTMTLDATSSISLGAYDLTFYVPGPGELIVNDDVKQLMRVASSGWVEIGAPWTRSGSAVSLVTGYRPAASIVRIASTSDAVNALIVEGLAQSTGAANAGQFFSVIASTNTSDFASSLFGLTGYVKHSGTGTVTGETVGVHGQVDDVGTVGRGTILEAVGVRGRVGLSSSLNSTIKNAVGVTGENAFTAGRASISVSVYGQNPQIQDGVAFIDSVIGLLADNVYGGTNTNVNVLIASSAQELGTIAAQPPAGNWSIYNASTRDNYFAGNLGIGTKNIGSALEVAGTASISGTTTLAGLTYTWPSTHGSSGYFLQNNGSGTLTWAAAGGGGVASDGLDFDEFEDSLVLDANLTVASAGFTVNWEPFFTSSIVPAVDDTYDLGTSTLRWRDVYVGPSSLHIGEPGNDTTISFNTTTGFIQIPDRVIFAEGASFSAGQNIEISGVASLSFARISDAINVGNLSFPVTSYSRFGVATTTHGLQAPQQVLISGVLEVDDQVFLDANASVSGNLEVGGSIFNAGNLGIGTTTTTAALTVRGAAGNNAIASFASASGAPVLYLAKTGNIGIGTTTIAARLHVVPQFAGDGLFLDKFDNSDGGELILDGNTKTWHLAENSGLFRIDRHGANNGSFESSDFVITTVGNVGIGTTTADTKLEVGGAASASGYFGAGLTDCDVGANDKLLWDSSTGRFSCGTDQSGASLTGWELQGSIVQLYNITDQVGIGTENLDGGVKLEVVGVASQSGNLLLPNTTANIGIGTNAPGARIHVSAGNAANGLLITGATTNGFRLTPNADGNSTIFNVTNAANTASWLTVNANGQIIMNGSGNVGIGNTSPQTKLDVSGTASVSALTVANNASVSGAFEVVGAASASATFGSGLADCDTGVSSKLLWDASTGLFSCGTDQTSSGGAAIGTSTDGVSFTNVSSITFAGAHFDLTYPDGGLLKLDWGSGGPASLSQDETVTGFWIFNNNASVTGGLEVTGVLKGGATTVSSLTATGQGSFANASVSGTFESATGKFTTLTNSTGTLSIAAHTLTGAVTGNSQNVTGLNNLTFAFGSASATFEAITLKATTIGGDGVLTLSPTTRVQISGNASISGNLEITGLASASTYYGGGLTSCNGGSQKLLWDSGVFSCGVDQSGSGGGSLVGFREGFAGGFNNFGSISFDAGKFTLDTGNSDVRLNLDWGAGGPASLSEDESVTGHWVFASHASVTGDFELTNRLKTVFASISNALEVSTYASASKYFGGGLLDCDDTTDKLVWTASGSNGGKFSCGVDQGGGSGWSADPGYTYLTTSTDNVGIGTSTPVQKLQVKTAGSTTLEYGAMVQNTNSTNGYTTGVLFSVEGTGNYGKGALVYTRTGSFGIGDFHFLQNTTANTTDAALGQEVLTIKSNGNVGIGSTAPTRLLDVAGALEANSFFGSGLSDCDNATTSKLLWDLTTGQFSCGTDQSGASGAGFQDNGSTVTLITDTDNVGIGTQNVSGAKLEVAGVASVSTLIVPNGNLGIRTTNPTSPLTVNGAATSTYFMVDVSSTSGFTNFAISRKGALLVGRPTAGDRLLHGVNDGYSQFDNDPFTVIADYTSVLDSPEDLYISGGLEVDDKVFFDGTASISGGALEIGPSTGGPSRGDFLYVYSYNANGSTVPNIANAVDKDTGIWWDGYNAPNDLYLTSGGVTKVWLDNTNNVGIGRWTATDQDVLTSQLYVIGAAGQNTMFEVASSSGNTNLIVGQKGNLSVGINASNYLSTQAPLDAYSQFNNDPYSNNTGYSSVINSPEDLLINGGLEVNDKAFFDGTASVATTFEVGDGATTNGYMYVGAYQLNNSTTPNIANALDKDTGIWWNSFNAPNDLYFTAGGTTAMFLGNDGNVGIGPWSTFNPDTLEAKLYIVGAAGQNPVFIAASSSGDANLVVGPKGNLSVGLNSGNQVSLYGKLDAFSQFNNTPFNVEPGGAGFNSPEDLFVAGSFEVDGGANLDGLVSISGPLEVTTGYVKVPDGTAALPGLRFQSSPTTGLFRAGADILGFTTAGAEAMRIDASNNVGIGTTTTSGARLSVMGGNVGIGTTTAPAQLTVRQDAAGDIVNILDGATEVFTILDGGNVGIVDSAPAAALSFGTLLDSPLIHLYEGAATNRYGSGIHASEWQNFIPSNARWTWNMGGDLQTSGTNEVMRLTTNSSGVQYAQLSIGTTTPAGMLTLRGAPSDWDNGPNTIAYTTTDVYPLFQQLNWTHDNISMNFDAYWNQTTWISGDVGSNFQITKGGTVADKLTFNVATGYAQGAAISWTTAMNIDSTGLVTLVRASVSNDFEVAGGDLFLEHAAQTTSASAPYISWTRNSDNFTPAQIGAMWSGGGFGGRLIFNTHTGANSTPGRTVLTERMRIDENGYIQMGTTTADGMLTVRQSNAADILNLYDGATNVLSVIDGGNVGIGTTTPTAPLHVVGDASTLFTIASGSTARFTVLESGNVGINDSTPTTALDITGNASISGGLEIGGSGITASTPIPLQVLTNRTYSASPPAGTTSMLIADSAANASQRILFRGSSGYNMAAIDQLDIGSFLSALSFGTPTVAGQISEKMRIMPTGNVGFYDTTPDARVEIVGSSTYDLFNLTSATAGSPDGGILTVESGGNVGIGATTPQMLFEVGGSILASGSGNVFLGTGYLQVSGTTAVSYNRFGTGTTGHSLSGQDDALVSGDLEVNGVLYADGGATITDLTVTGSTNISNTNITNVTNITGTGDSNFGQFIADGGSAADAAFTFESNLGTGMYLGTGQLEFSVGGSEKVSIRSDGLYVDNTDLHVAGTYYVGSTPGITQSCGNDQYLENIDVTEGIVTGGNCQNDIDTTDIAENFFSMDDDIEPGMLVSAYASGGLDFGVTGTLSYYQQGVVRASGSYQAGVIGVVSTHPAMTLGSSLGDGTGQDVVPVAIAGRVPVQVTMANGAIRVGDRIAVSDIPGLGMKATKAGMTVGIALEPTSDEATSGSVQSVIVFMSPAYWSPSIADELAALNEAGPEVIITSEGFPVLSELFAAVVKMFEKTMHVVFQDGLIQTLKGVFGEVQTDKLCVGQTCVTEEQLQQLLDAQNIEPAGTPAPSATPAPSDSPTPTPTPDGSGGGGDVTPTPDVTPDVTPDPTPDATPEPTPDETPEPDPTPDEPAPEPEPTP